MEIQSTGASTKDVIWGVKDNFRCPVLCQQYWSYCFKMRHISVLQTFRNGRWNSTHILTNDILCWIKPIYNQRSSLPHTIRSETTIKVKNILYIKAVDLQHQNSKPEHKSQGYQGVITLNCGRCRHYVACKSYRMRVGVFSSTCWANRCIQNGKLSGELGAKCRERERERWLQGLQTSYFKSPNVAVK
jgi:hypothetical protein